MKEPPVLCLLLPALFIGPCLSFSYDGPVYDSSSYTECRTHPEKPLYNGILKGQQINYRWTARDAENRVHLPVVHLQNLTGNTFYSFSSWVKVHDADSALVRVSLVAQTINQGCVGTVLAKSGCWSFLKGGFVMASPSIFSNLYFQSSDGENVKIELASVSLQPFSKKQWRRSQEEKINKERKRAAVIHVSSRKGAKLQGVKIEVKQVTKDFLIGSSIGKTILGNLSYQNWFIKRFSAAVFENELKWNAVEPQQGKINYTIADQMLEFVRAHNISVRGRGNIFWEDPRYIPKWVHNVTGSKLHSAVKSRVRSLLSKYKEEFLHWDVGNVRFSVFYEQRIGPQATFNFFQAAHQSDPLATLFMNEFNVVETCSDVNSTVDTYISRLRELKQGGIAMDGIGLEGHFAIPNPPLMRAILDKLATLGLPVWLTELDISKTFSKEKQAIYLEEVLREGFSHPSVKGIMLWTAFTPEGCYQMCLTDKDFQNLPAGDIVDKLLKEWQTGILEGQTNEHGSFSFHGFLGEHKVTASYGDKSVISTFSLSPGDDSTQVYIHL